jgi:hypothetical protein
LGRGVILAVVAVMAISLAGGGSSSREPDVTWDVGNCISGTERAVPVECDGTEDGEIVDFVSDAEDCPVDAEHYVTRDEGIYCIDTE